MRIPRRSAALAIAVVVVALQVMLPTVGDAAPAKSGKGTFHSLAGCAAICAYWDVPTAAGYKECANPFPGSKGQFYDDYIVTVPKGMNFLEYKIKPLLDWDSYICAGWGSHELVSSGANAVGASCTGILGADDPTGEGCSETARAAVTPGKKYILRAYNWSDPPAGTCPFTWQFRRL